MAAALAELRGLATDKVGKRLAEADALAVDIDAEDVELRDRVAHARRRRHRAHANEARQQQQHGAYQQPAEGEQVRARVLHRDDVVAEVAHVDEAHVHERVNELEPHLAAEGDHKILGVLVGILLEARRDHSRAERARVVALDDGARGLADPRVRHERIDVEAQHGLDHVEWLGRDDDGEGAHDPFDHEGEREEQRHDRDAKEEEETGVHAQLGAEEDEHRSGHALQHTSELGQVSEVLREERPLLAALWQQRPRTLHVHRHSAAPHRAPHVTKTEAVERPPVHLTLGDTGIHPSECFDGALARLLLPFLALELGGRGGALLLHVGRHCKAHAPWLCRSVAAGWPDRGGARHDRQAA